VQLLCGQRAVCQRYGSLSDRNQQNHQLHADKHVESCHLHKELHCHVEESWILLTSKLNVL
jgi:hypothetical protein